MKMKNYKDVTPAVRKKALLKYLKDPDQALIKIKKTSTQEEFQAIEIWEQEEYLLIVVDPTVLSALNWDVYAQDLDDEDYGDFNPDEFSDDLGDDMNDTYYA